MHAYVYELYNSAGEPIYVGATLNPAARLATHRRKRWWAQIDGSQSVITRHESVSAARDAERERIRTLRPRSNRAGLSTPYVPYSPLTVAPDVSGLMPEGARMIRARLAVEEALSAARTAAIAAMGAGMSESEAARQYGVTRMTIRAWKKGSDQ